MTYLITSIAFRAIENVFAPNFRAMHEEIGDEIGDEWVQGRI